MNLILNIDTAVQKASVTLANGASVLGTLENATQKDHAAWLHVAIKELLEKNGYSINQLKAVAVSAGPGSYTGLRVGMAAAKGLCYALDIPLITVNTLQMMALAALGQPAPLLAPMIDARRMEVFTAVYNKSLQPVMEPINLILSPESYHSLLAGSVICFFGNGSLKFKEIASHPNALFATVEASANHMVPLSWEAFQHQQFADLAYTEPFYGKDFYSPSPKIL